MTDDYDYQENHDPMFAAWMREVNRLCLRETGVSIFDLPDWHWRVAYDAGDPAHQAWRDAVDDGILE